MVAAQGAIKGTQVHDGGSSSSASATRSRRCAGHHRTVNRLRPEKVACTGRSRTCSRVVHPKRRIAKSRNTHPAPVPSEAQTLVGTRPRIPRTACSRRAPLAESHRCTGPASPRMLQWLPRNDRLNSVGNGVPGEPPAGCPRTRPLASDATQPRSFSCGFAALNFLMLPLGTRPASLCILALAYALSLFRGNRPTSPTSQKEVDPHKGQQPKNDRGPPGETRSSHYAPPGCCHAQ